jgi:hypothetical protein
MLGLAPSFFTVRSSPNTASFAFASASNQSASIADAAQTGLEISGAAMTLMCWVNFTSAAAQHCMMGRWDPTTGFFCYTMIYTFDRIYFRVRNPADVEQFVEWTFTPVNGAWNHYALVWDGTLTPATGSMKFYLNGVQYIVGETINLNNTIVAVQDLAVPYSIGAFGDGASPVNGLIDEARVFNTVLSEAEIAAMMSVQIPGTTAGLQGYWRANNTPLDETPNANNLTLNNGAGYSVVVPFP